LTSVIAEQAVYPRGQPTLGLIEHMGVDVHRDVSGAVVKQLHDLSIGGAVEQQKACAGVPVVMNARWSDRGPFEEPCERFVNASGIDRSTAPASKDQIWRLMWKQRTLAGVGTSRSDLAMALESLDTHCRQGDDAARAAALWLTDDEFTVDPL
jgi:hypothetical protein